MEQGEGAVSDSGAPAEPPSEEESTPGPDSTVADYPLGAEIVTLGPRAATVFAASSRVRGSLDDEHIDLVVVDTPEEIEDSGPPTVALADLAATCSVAALDPLTFNPTGWVRKPTAGVGASDRRTCSRRVPKRTGWSPLTIVTRCASCITSRTWPGSIPT